MINEAKLNSVISEYKSIFAHRWSTERFKLEAIKCFQDNWNINAEVFSEMFEKSTSQTSSLLTSVHRYPKGMIQEFSKTDNEATRQMFIALFDETVDLSIRIKNFIKASDEMQKKYSNGNWKNHYQNSNAISTYLWLMYPDKYYIFKYRSYSAIAKFLECSDFCFGKGKIESVTTGFAMYDEIREFIVKDSELLDMYEQIKDEKCYKDPENKTLTFDFCFYLSVHYLDDSDSSGDVDGSDINVWWPTLEEYTPGFSKEDWLKILNNTEIIGPVWGNVLAKFYTEPEGITCSELAKKYNDDPFSISGKCTQLGKKIHLETGCPLCSDEDRTRYWPILFIGRKASKDESGVWAWKLRQELYEALTEFGIEQYLNINKDKKINNMNYWWMTANPKIWSWSSINVGEQQSYSLYNDNGNKRRIFQNFLDAKAGDIVIGYESTPVKKVVAIARITAEQNGKELSFEKIEGLTSPIDYQTLLESPELKEMEYMVNPQGSLFKLQKSEYDYIMELIRDDNPISEIKKTVKYDKQAFLNQVYMSEQRYDSLVSLLKNKKNLILQGAPGVGKTFAAKRIAYSIMGEINDDYIEFIQFHQNYSYEDFMMGYKPSGEGFELKYGVFYQFCQKAANQPDKDFFFIIDEINRGNMSKIFGELLMLIEKDYRGEPAKLAYDGMKFSVPKNIYIIGMMNTADRSLAMIDYALRRRFSFIDMMPGFESDGFKKYQNSLNNNRLNKLIDEVKNLNEAIKNDGSLGKGFCIGHSYFCGHSIDDGNSWLNEVVEFDLIPTLQEYWFDDDKTSEKWSDILRGAIK